VGFEGSSPFRGPILGRRVYFSTPGNSLLEGKRINPIFPIKGFISKGNPLEDYGRQRGEFKNHRGLENFLKRKSLYWGGPH